MLRLTRGHLAVAAALMVAVLGAKPATATPAPVLCLTATYEVLSAGKQPIVDDCWGPSWWDERAGEDGCTGPAQAVQVCRDWAVAFPAP